MIVNTELEQKGNLFPSALIAYQKDVDTLYFTSKNNVVLQVTIVRDSVIRFRYATTGKFENDFSYGITIHASRGYNFLEVTEEAAVTGSCSALSFHRLGHTQEYEGTISRSRSSKERRTTKNGRGGRGEAEDDFVRGRLAADMVGKNAQNVDGCKRG